MKKIGRTFPLQDGDTGNPHKIATNESAIVFEAYINIETGGAGFVFEAER